MALDSRDQQSPSSTALTLVAACRDGLAWATPTLVFCFSHSILASAAAAWLLHASWAGAPGVASAGKQLAAMASQRK